jgi:hypothetical protein
MDEKSRSKKAVWEGDLPLPQTAFCKEYSFEFNGFGSLSKSLHELQHFIDVPRHFHSTPFFHQFASGVNHKS